MPATRKTIRAASLAMAMAALAACATAPADDPEAAAELEAVNDPFETPNRFVFSANVMLDQLALQPAAVTYRDLFPDELKPPVRNFITNLFMPVSAVNAFLQGDLDRGERALARFVTAVPTLLLADTMPDERPVFEDAGQTLAVWGADEGPYLMLPLLGPSNLRDGIGTVADFFLDPVSLVAGSEVTIGRAVGQAVLQRSSNLEQVRDLQRTSVDYYAAVRSLYRQQRAIEIRNGDVEPMKMAPTIGLDDDVPDDEMPNEEAANGK